MKKAFAKVVNNSLGNRK
jgi:hypothetical protein